MITHKPRLPSTAERDSDKRYINKELYELFIKDCYCFYLSAMQVYLDMKEKEEDERIANKLFKMFKF